MKISQVTLPTIKDSIGVTGEYSDSLIEIYKTAAISFIAGYTGLSTEQIDTHEDITVAYLCLIGDMFERRTMTVDKATINPTAKQILSMYAVNLVG